MFQRNRILRKSEAVRKFSGVNILNSRDFVYPIFICDKKELATEINGMPEIYRVFVDDVCTEIDECLTLSLSNIMLFPYVSTDKKDESCSEAVNENGVMALAIRKIKEKYRDSVNIIADVALDPYTIHGHDGILTTDFQNIDNDKTLKILTKQSVILAQAGADFVSPSDMMDGRVCSIRSELDKNGYNETGIISYSAKFASTLYKPFRAAINSGIKNGPTNKLQYQINPQNSVKSSLKSVFDDIEQGANAVIVKPAMMYLDVLQQISQEALCPVFAYQVSGEYAMLYNSCGSKEDRNAIVLESLTCIKRAGADCIISYFAKDVCKNLINNK